MAKKTIDKKYEWDLTEIFATQEEFNKALKKVRNYSKKILSFKGQIAKADATTYLKFQDILKKKEEVLWKILIYAQKYDAQMNDRQASMNKSAVMQLGQELAVAETWISSEVRKLGERKIISFVKGSKKHAYLENSVKEYFRIEKFHLKENDEKFAANFVKLFSSSETLYTQMAFADKKFPTINYKGKDVKLTASVYSDIMESTHVAKDQELRQKAGHLKRKCFADNQNTYCELYSTLITTNMTMAKLKGYSSALHAGLHEENVPEEVFLNFIKSAYAHSNILYEYNLIHRKELKTRGAKKYFETDRSLPIIPLEKNDLKFTVEQGRKICLEALKPLGKEYGKHLQEAIKFGRIDYHEREGKTDGGYSAATAYTPPYILMNWANDYQSVSTLIHELGHSTHSSISNSHNRPEYSQYTILLAEIASTFCELLLNDYLLKKYENNVPIKASLLQQSIDSLSTLYFFTAKGSNFEYKANQAAFEGKTTDKSFLQELIKSVDFKQKVFDKPKKEYYANNLYLSWPSVLHHYLTFFYMYKYALSLVVSCNLYVDFVKTGDPSKFVNLLKSGASDSSLKLIKKYAGVDLENTSSHDRFFEVFQGKVQQLKDIFK